MRGRIKSTQATYAFTTGEDGVDRFFHRRDVTVPGVDITRYTDLRLVLPVGTLIRFEPVEHERGPRAILVHVGHGH